MKHAYLILAHNEFALLQHLVSAIDDPRNDIYVHIDKKVKDLPTLHTEKAGLTFLTQRTDIHWADLSMVKAEYALFETASAHGPYQYYHLLSGVDLPIKSQNYIHDFFDRHDGKEFIGFTLTEMTPELIRRTQRWHMFPKHFSQTRNRYSAPRAAFLRLQEILGLKRNHNVSFMKGSQWVSVTERMARYFLNRRAWVMNTFTHTFAPDECVMQTLAVMSPLRVDLFNTHSDAAGCMRAIGWRNGRLIDWEASDYDKLARSPALFARKFNSRDPQFIERILKLSQP